MSILKPKYLCYDSTQQSGITTILCRQSNIILSVSQDLHIWAACKMQTRLGGHCLAEAVQPAGRMTA